MRWGTADQDLAALHCLLDLDGPDVLSIAEVNDVSADPAQRCWAATTTSRGRASPLSGGCPRLIRWLEQGASGPQLRLGDQELMLRERGIRHDLADLLEAFDELCYWSSDRLGIYALRYTREDGLSVYLSFSMHKLAAQVSVHDGSNVTCSRVVLRRCVSVRVLERTARRWSC